jgi:ArsR family transcriptional regulator, arsenate/arsenite/antimonite-responsive transcriptional repressor / arsenate reductase (thioredoxin)
VDAPASGSVPPVVRLLADPLRWRLAQELASGDYRVRELVAATGTPQNLVSYHLRQLREGGLVTTRRSSFDARDTYYSLDLSRCSQALAAVGASLHPGLGHVSALTGDHGLAMPPGRRRVLFVCTGNSSRSPMAEGLLRHRTAGRVRSASAGIRPKPVHPDAAAVMHERYGVDISRHRPTSVGAVAAKHFDYVISLCDKAREVCPEFAGHPARIHWSLADPAADEGGLAGYPAFEHTAAELDIRIRFLLPAMDAAAFATA